jgi:predicted ABC-type ATPase
MILLAGPNGAGKTTLYKTRVAPAFAGPFVNADIIQRDELGDNRPEAAYEAAEIAAMRRSEALAKQDDFVTETVFSHPSKLISSEKRAPEVTPSG